MCSDEYGVIHSQTQPSFQHMPPFCTTVFARPQLLANLIQHGYNQVQAAGTRLSGSLLHSGHSCQRPQAHATMKPNDNGCSIGSDIVFRISEGARCRRCTGAQKPPSRICCSLPLPHNLGLSVVTSTTSVFVRLRPPRTFANSPPPSPQRIV